METGQKIIQPSNNIDHSSPNILSIQVSLNGLSFCILNSHTKTITYHKTEGLEKKHTPQELQEKLEALLESDSRLQQPFSAVNLIYDNELFTLVPQPLFEEDHLADYLKFNSRILQTDFISYDTIESVETNIVYVPYVNINNFLYDRFGEFVYKHFSTILIEKVISNYASLDGPSMYINVNESHFEIIVLDKKQLILFNSFDYATKEDFIYYILFTAEQLKLNPEEFTIHLFGRVNEGDELFNITYKYVRHVQLVELEKPYKIALGFEIGLKNNFVLQHSF